MDNAWFSREAHKRGARKERGDPLAPAPAYTRSLCRARFFCFPPAPPFSSCIYSAIMACLRDMTYISRCEEYTSKKMREYAILPKIFRLFSNPAYSRSRMLHVCSDFFFRSIVSRLHRAPSHKSTSCRWEASEFEQSRD